MNIKLLNCRWPAALASLLLLLVAPLRAAEQADPWRDGQRFVSAAFHDVVDAERDLNDDAITTDRLIAFFEWLRADGWTAISLDDVAAAREGRRPLPAKAILVSFDDGYQSLYTRVWPLATAYRVPILAALVSSWMDGAPGSTVRYGDSDVPREHFISWAQAREMQRSGVVEFASHSDNLHRGVLGNSQGNTMPAAITAKYDPATGYENEAAMRARLRADLAQSHAQLTRELGRAPRAVVWPFGRYSVHAIDAAREAGFTYTLTLEPAPATATRPLSLARYLPIDNPTIGEMAGALRFASPLPAARRWVCIDAGLTWSTDPAQADELLGAAVERVRALGATAVLIDPVQRRIDAPPRAWFTTPLLPLAGDWLARLSWQMQTRAGVEVYLRLPRGDEGIDLVPFASELAHRVPMTGLLSDESTLALPATDREPLAGAPWQVALRRAQVDRAGLAPAARATLDAVDAAVRHRPGLQLVLLDRTDAPSTPAALADLRLVPRELGAPAPTVERFAARRVGSWHDTAAGSSGAPAEAPQLVRAVRELQVKGGTAVGYCPDEGGADRPQATVVAPAFSASTFPLKR